jgi:hypothetical protein
MGLASEYASPAKFQPQCKSEVAVPNVRIATSQCNI